MTDVFDFILPIYYREYPIYEARIGPLSAGDSADDQERLFALHDCFGKGCIRRLVRQIFLAGKEAQERPALLRIMIADSAAQHGILRLESVEDRAQRHWALDFELYLAANLGQRAQVLREFDPDHWRVCTSMESTAGRSRTNGAQVSPASFEA